MVIQKVQIAKARGNRLGSALKTKNIVENDWSEATEDIVVSRRS